MRTLRLLIVSVLTILGLAVGGTASASASPKGGPAPKCRHITAVASGQGQFNPDNSIDTSAIVTKDPLLKGTLAGRFEVTGAPTPDLPFAGSVTFTTKKGTLTVGATGAVTATGDFVTNGPVTAGTGDFVGATGHLTITGKQDPTGAFTETIEGRVCLSR